MPPWVRGRNGDWLLVGVLFAAIVIGHFTAQWLADVAVVVFLVVIAVRVVRRLV